MREVFPSEVVDVARRPGPEDAAAFSAVFAEQAPRLYRTALGLLGNPHDASDALQEAGLKALRYWSGLQRREAAPAWLTRILINCCHNVGRRRSTATPAGLLVTGTATAGAPPMDPDVWDALGTLPPEQRETVVLRFYHDLSVAQIARITQVPEGTVKSRLHAALSRLRTRLTGYVEEEAR